MVDEPVEPIHYVETSGLYYRLIDNGTRVLLAAIRGATIVGLGLCTFWSIEALAGKATDAQIAILIGYLAEKGSGLTVGIALLTGSVGILYGYLQLRLKRRVIQAFDDYRKAIEGPQRTSSQLDQFGQTNPRDRH